MPSLLSTLLSLIFLNSWAFAGLPAPSHLAKLKAKFPFGLIGDDHGILTIEDLSINTRGVYPSPFNENSLAYPYWQCFETRTATASCSDAGYDETERGNLAVFSIELTNQDAVHTYTTRRAIHRSGCDAWIQSWQTLTQGERYACLSGPL
jgi:hypothetical protein